MNLSIGLDRDRNALVNSTLLHALKLESEGRFTEMESELIGETDVFVRVLWLRAVMINGSAKSLERWETHYQKEVAQLLDHPEPDVRIRALLAASQRLRRRGNPSEARQYAESALAQSNSNGKIQLASEAEFALGICLGEIGEKFLALAIFEKLSKNEILPVFRRNLAFSNVCLLLWELGRLDAFEKSIDLLPNGFDFHCRLILAMAKGDWAFAERLTAQGIPKCVPPNQYIQICFDYAYYRAVVKGELRWESMPFWFQEILCKLRRESTDQFGYLLKRIVDQKEVVDGAFRPFSFVDSEAPYESLSLRMKVDLLYLQLVAAVAKGQKRSTAIEWFMSVMSRGDHPWRKDPLAPVLEKDSGTFVGESPWVDALRAHLGMTVTRFPEMKVVGTTIQTGDKHLDLSRSPASLVVFNTLLRYSGRSLSKAELHTALTRSSYVPAKHDARLFKLLQRLKDRLEGVEIQSFWHFGQNGKIHIEKISSHGGS